MRRFLIFISILISGLIIASTSWAQITVNDVKYASNVSENEDGSIAKIFGGIAGNAATCNALGTTTLCNTCTVKDFACNRSRIHSNLKLRINFTVAVEFSGVLSVGTDTSGTFNSLTIASADKTTGTLSNGTVGFVNIDWSALCAATPTGDTTCNIYGGATNLIIGLAANATTEPDAANRISIPIDVTIPNADLVTPAADGYDLVDCADLSPSTGICNFLAYPGDRKIFVDQLQKVGAWPQSNTVNIKYLRVYYSTASFDDANYDSGSFADFDLDENGVPTSDVIEGLENDVPYFFRPAIVDDAFNVAFLVDEAEIDLDADCAADTDAGCDLIATPAEVFGLLSEDVNCFVSTAAYGSSLATEVRTFRKFRNKFLLRSDLGRKLNNLYYEYGPIAARFIIKYDFLKPVVRTALWPVAYLADQSNRRGLHIFILGLLAIGILFGGFIIGGRQLWQKF